jgi:hypothetical membrane protein
MRRLAGALGVAAPPAAAVAVLIAGSLTPAYDPFVRTISRLAERGAPAAFVVELAITVVGVVMIIHAKKVRPG